MLCTPRDAEAQTIALLAGEWFKAARRLSRIVQDTTPARQERERAQLDFAWCRIERALAGHGMRIVMHDGQAYSPQLPAEPVNPEDFDGEEGLVVAETIEPTVLLEGRIIARGRIVLAQAG